MNVPIAPPAIVAVLLMAFSASLIHAADRPNILLTMADDLGHECLGAYGGRSYETPHLDALAGSGIRFDNCFSTLASLTGADLPQEVTVDGQSFVPQLRGRAGDPRE